MYIQDNWQVNDKLNVLIGYRTDVAIDDTVTAGRFGFDYDATDAFFDSFLNGKTYDWLPVESVTVRGGYGRFVGRSVSYTHLRAHETLENLV